MKLSVNILTTMDMNVSSWKFRVALESTYGNEGERRGMVVERVVGAKVFCNDATASSTCRLQTRDCRITRMFVINGRKAREVLLT